MINRKNTLVGQGVHCVTLLALGISNFNFLSFELQSKLMPFTILAMVLAMVVYLRDLSRYSKRDLELETQDERNQMILEKAVWYCYRTEDWVLLALFGVCSLWLHRYDISFAIWWLIIGRYLLTFVIRWRLNRKY